MPPTAGGEGMNGNGPPGGHRVAATVQRTVGGTYRLDNALASGRLVTITGTFIRVEAPHLLVYTWHIEQGDSLARTHHRHLHGARPHPSKRFLTRCQCRFTFDHVR